MIRTENLTKRYGRSEALHELTMEVPPASAFALIGPNGAGKSTAFKIVMNLVRPSAGRAEILGVDSRRLGAGQLAEIGYVSENQNLPEWMRVRYFLSYSKALYPSWDDSLAAELVRQYELPLDRRLRQLSRGMKVKAALVASLASRPRLVILDEPFGGLDVLVREQLIESIIDRTPESTVLIASHDLAEIESFATHIGYLNEGRIEFVEETTSLLSRFREVELKLEQPAPLPDDLPKCWLNPEQSGVVVRFIDTDYDASRLRQEVTSRFAGVDQITTRELGFRAVFLALARARRRQCA